MKNTIFYKPKTGFVADVIPFFDKKKDEFNLFYLHDYRDHEKYGEGTPWYLLKSKNLLEFDEVGEVIPRGTVEEQDLYIFTGSIFQDDLGKYHLYYTGHNPHFREKGLKEQAIMHAVSDDLINFTKIPENTFYASEDFDEHNWRDPFVFFDEDSREYKMLITTRTVKGPKERSGVVLMYKSDDLHKWEYDAIIWEPNLYFAHECADVFKIGDWWYMIYSEFTDKCKTRCVMSKSLYGPWHAPKNDSFDGRAYYAAKSTLASDGKRYLFGWNPTKENGDNSNWHWGGSLVVHEIYQNDGNELSVGMPFNYQKHFFEDEPVIFDDINLKNVDGFSEFILKNKIDESFGLSFEINNKFETYRSGIRINYDRNNDQSYSYNLNYYNNTISFDNLPRPHWRFNNFLDCDNNVIFNKNSKIKLIYENGVVIFYLDDKKVLSSRMYCEKTMSLSFYVMHGEVDIKNIKYFKVK